jgi:PTS system mannose-specific IIC component
MPTVLLAILLGCWNGLGIIIGLSGIGISTALTNGVITGLLIGNVSMGFQVGATCLLMSIGFFTYGGATIPDYKTGAIFGVIVGSTAGLEAGLIMSTLLALLLTQMDILGRATTTVFQHAADNALAKNNIGKFEMWTLLGVVPWFLGRFIPVFVGVLLKDDLKALSDFANKFAWVSNGLRVVGKALPAVGFALLLSYMDLKKYWPFMVIGYVMYAYMGVSTIGLAIAGTAAAALYIGGGLGLGKKEAK